MNKISQENIDKIRTLEAEGRGVRETSRLLNITKGTVINYRVSKARDARLPNPKTIAVPPDMLVACSTPGICACGCGKRTTIQITGPNKGLPARWVNGHRGSAIREALKIVRNNYRSHTERAKSADMIRKKAIGILKSDSTITKDDLLDRFAGLGFDRANLSRIIINGATDETRGLARQAIELRKRRASDTARIWRNETDLACLVGSPAFISMAAPLRAGEEESYAFGDLIPSLDMDPRETLIWKEEIEKEQGEWNDRIVRAKCFKEWRDRNTGMVNLGEALNKSL